MFFKQEWNVEFSYRLEQRIIMPISIFKQDNEGHSFIMLLNQIVKLSLK